MLDRPHPAKPGAVALTCLTEVEVAMIGGRIGRAFLVDDAPTFDDLIARIDLAELDRLAMRRSATEHEIRW